MIYNLSLSNIYIHINYVNELRMVIWDRLWIIIKYARSPTHTVYIEAFNECYMTSDWWLYIVMRKTQWLSQSFAMLTYIEDSAHLQIQNLLITSVHLSLLDWFHSSLFQAPYLVFPWPFFTLLMQSLYRAGQTSFLEGSSILPKWFYLSSSLTLR